MLGKVWDEITSPFLNFNGATVEVKELISNFIPNFIMDVITYPQSSSGAMGCLWVLGLTWTCQYWTICSFMAIYKTYVWKLISCHEITDDKFYNRPINFTNIPLLCINQKCKSLTKYGMGVHGPRKTRYMNARITYFIDVVKYWKHSSSGVRYNQVEGRLWIHVQHVNLRAARRFTCCS